MKFTKSPTMKMPGIKTNKPKIAFWGTPRFAVFVLEEMKKSGIVPDLIVTAPDKPKGRRLILTPPPVKDWATANGVSFIQPEKLSDLKLEKDFDLFVLAAYGKIIPREILDIPKKGTLNVHPSLLPLFRGASPIQSAILSGEKETGVSVILLDEEMDHGPVLAKEKIPLENTATYLALEKTLAELGGKMISETIPRWLKGEAEIAPQDHDAATYCQKIKKEDGSIDPKYILSERSNEKDIELAERKVRALNPDPGTFTFIEKNGKKTRVKILSAKIESGKLVPIKVTPEGKKEMGWEEFLRGSN